MTKQVLKIKKTKNVWNDYKYTRQETISLNREIRKNKNKTLMYGWVSATKTKNYLMDDMCVDWLMLYHKNKDTKENTNFKPFTNVEDKGKNIFITREFIFLELLLISIFSFVWISLIIIVSPELSLSVFMATDDDNDSSCFKATAFAAIFSLIIEIILFSIFFSIIDFIKF